MTDAEIQQYLGDNGYPEHIVREGRAGLMRRWREFVEQVERGYALGLKKIIATIWIYGRFWNWPAVRMSRLRG